MKSFDSDIKKYTEKVRLKAMERRELRERVLAYMEYHPLPKQKKYQIEQIASEHFIMVHFNTLYTKVAGGVLAIILVVGIPLAAERSVPGDVLYLVKTGLNENVQSQFANSPYEKVAFETKLLERRISEARLLASEGKLTEEVSAEIAEDVRGHANAAQLGLDEMRADDTEAAAIAEVVFDSALEVQSAVLDTEVNSKATSSTNGIRDVVKNAQTQALEKKGSSTPSFEKLMARIEIETTRAYELFEAINDSATEEERSDIERRLSDIDRKIIGAQNKQATDPKQAIADLLLAVGLTQKLVVFMTDIDVRENVTLETLIPVELTDEERTIAIETVLGDIVVLQENVVKRQNVIVGEALVTKVELGMDKLTDLINQATTSLSLGMFSVAEEAVKEAYELATDLDSLTIAYEIDATIGDGEILDEDVDDETTVDEEEDIVEDDLSAASTTENVVTE